MAPTEILAEQHFASSSAGWSRWASPRRWLTGSQKTRERREMLALIESGEARWWWARTR
jgi:ATP-dependent DNA helicase RecG